MSAMSRRKGHSYEREVVNLIKDSGHSCARNLDQVRDGGGDIPFGDWLIECKRRATIAIYPWWDQVVIACRRKTIPRVTAVEHQTVHFVPHAPRPALVIRADKRENLVVIRLSDFLELVSRTHDSAGSGPVLQPVPGPG